jgi:predicted MPP superfamily phosphohydrolase
MVKMTSDRPDTHGLTRRTFLVGSGALAATMALYSSLVARHEISVLSQRILVDNLPSAFVGHRIVQLSDFHLEEFTEPFFLERVVAQVNRLNPDIVLLTGDFITRGSLNFLIEHHAASRCAEILATIRCAQKFAVLGNHDVAVSAPMVTAALQRQGLPVLHNRYESLTLRGDTLNIAGTADPGTDRPDLTTAIPSNPTGPVILMSHAPDYADFVVSHPRGSLVDLMLSGHSHGGQVRLPLVGPLVLPPLGRKYVEGLFHFNRLQLYVNRGLGTVGIPIRLNCPPEITLITLDRQTQAT